MPCSHFLYEAVSKAQEQREMLYPSFTREIGPAEALYAEELDFSRYIWLHKPRRRDSKKPGSNTGGPKVFSIHVGLDSHMGGDTGLQQGVLL